MKYLIFGIILMTVIGKKIYDVSNAINDEFDLYFQRSGERNNIDPNYIKALGLNESWLGKYKNEVVVNGEATSGIMHLELPTARDYLPGVSREELLKPENEIEIATKHFKWLLGQTNNNLDHAVRAYNGGIGRLREYLRGEAPDIWVKNTNEYLERFKRNLKRLS